MGYSLGIDFGTSATKASIKGDDGKLVSLRISRSDKESMPSVVAYEKIAANDVRVKAVGEDAEVVPDENNYTVVRDIKRFVGIRDSASSELPLGDYKWWNQKDNCVDLWGTAIKPEEVVLPIVEEALTRAISVCQRLGLPSPTSALSRLEVKGWPMMLGCSVTAGLETRRTMCGIARKLGFSSFRFEDIREEPVLASLPYLDRELISGQESGQILLVYDFGGGTFDTAVILIDSPQSGALPHVTVLAADGEAFCGGTDIDKALAEYISKQIVERYFKNDLNLVGGIKDKLIHHGYARDAKEILSSVKEHRLLLPPGMLGRSDVIEVNITRGQLEEVLRGTKLIERTTECVLRAWRKARMVYRTSDEAHGHYNLRWDKGARIASKFITKLGFEDLRQHVNRVLLVGGTTKIPLVKQRLGSVLDSKFISESDPTQPIAACSLGGALRREHVGSIVDRLPFSILVKDGRGTKEMYRAYTPTVEYEMVMRQYPRIRPYTSTNVCATFATEAVEVQYLAPDGSAFANPDSVSLSPGEHSLEINSYGFISLRRLPSGGPEGVNNPVQHEMQKEQWRKVLDETARREADSRARLEARLKEKPGEERLGHVAESHEEEDYNDRKAVPQLTHTLVHTVGARFVYVKVTVSNGGSVPAQDVCVSVGFDPGNNENVRQQKSEPFGVGAQDRSTVEMRVPTASSRRTTVVVKVRYRGFTVSESLFTI